MRWSPPRPVRALAVCALLGLPALATARADDAPAPAARPDPEGILRMADEIRNPAESYFVRVRVATEGTGEQTNVFEVSIQGNDRTLVKTVEPARDRGRDLLMLGEEMWAYIPNLKRAVRVSLNQRLSGQAANGDITRMRWSGDYEASLESDDGRCWVLQLRAKKKGLTYEKIRVWIERETHRPVKAEYLTPADKVLKRAEFQDYGPLAGKIRPREIVIVDAIRQENRSWIRMLEMQPRKFPASLFQQSNLGE